MAFTPRIEINGAIKTSENVLANINKIAAACQSFVTWDPAIGSWRVIINRQGTSVMTFDDSNIVGSITVSGAGINDMYNSVRVGYANKDADGKKSERILNLPTEDRFDRELDNQLSLDFEFVNDPVQAELLGAIELKQSRADKIIEFATDYRAIGLRAGDIFGVNNEYYFERSSVNPKLFRAITVEEIDAEDGGILLQITGIEYLSTVYNTDGLTREETLIDSGIIPKSENICVIEKEAAAVVNQVDYHFTNGNVLASSPNSFLNLVNSVNDLYNSLGGSGSLFEKVFDIFEDETGANLRQIFSGSGGVSPNEIWTPVQYTKIIENINGVCIEKITSITFNDTNNNVIFVNFDLTNATDVSP